MHRISRLAGCMWLTFCVPLFAYANPQQSRESDCKSLIKHAGFAEFVLPSEGGEQKLPIKAGPSAKWTIQNSDYVEWVEIIDGTSGTGPGTLTIQLGANTGKACRAADLTITGVLTFYGSTTRIGTPIRILQRGVEATGAQEPAQPPHPTVINLAPSSGKGQEAARPKTQFIKK